jgi:hypothetical protein
MALRLARLFGTTAEFWMNLQVLYDLERARDEVSAEIEEAVAPLRGGRARRLRFTARRFAIGPQRTAATCRYSASTRVVPSFAVFASVHRRSRSARSAAWPFASSFANARFVGP